MELISRLQHRSRRRKNRLGGAAAHGGGADHPAAEGHATSIRQSAIRKVLTDGDADNLTPALGGALRRSSVPSTQHGIHSPAPVGLGAQTTELRSSSFREELLEGSAVPVSHREADERGRRRRAEPRRGPPPAPRPPVGPVDSGSGGSGHRQYADALASSSSEDEGPGRHAVSDRRRPTRACRVHGCLRGGVHGLEACRVKRLTGHWQGQLCMLAAAAACAGGCGRVW